MSLETDQEVASDGMPKRSKARVFAMCLALYLTIFISALDQTVLTTAVPTIATDLKSSTSFAWIGGAYLLSSAACCLIWTKFSDIWGRKPILLIVVTWFAGASIICATAPSIAILILGRSLQGLAGGALMAISIICFSDIFSIRTRALLFAFTEIVWSIAGGIGPVVGGLLAEYSTWRWIFWLQLPICGICFALVAGFLDVHNPRTPAMEGLKAIDWLGSFLILTLTTLVLTGVNLGGIDLSWTSPTVLALLIVGSFIIIPFVASQKFAKYPLIPSAIIKDLSAVATLVTVFCHGMVFMSFEYYLPLYFQSSRLDSQFQSGLLFLPYILADTICGILGCVYMHQARSYRPVIWFGMLFVTVGSSLYTIITPHTKLGIIILFHLITGMGIGSCFNAFHVSMQARFLDKQHFIAQATALLAFTRLMACAIGIVVCGTVIENGMLKQAGNLRAAGLNETMVATFGNGEAAANVLLIKQIGNSTQREAVQLAFNESLRHCWILLSSVAGIGFLASFFIKKSALRSEHTETKTGLVEYDNQKGLNLRSNVEK